MTKSNFEKIAKAPKLARPPRADEVVGANLGYGAVRTIDGRSARRTGRTVQFATVVSEEFKRWMKVQAAARGKSQAALLDDMKAAYIEKYGEE
jgi:hypothetical protein